MKSSKGLVKLNADANEAVIKMVKEIKNLDDKASINKSKLTSIIVLDYFNSRFEKDKKNLVELLRDQKKALRAEISALSEEQLNNMAKYLEKLKNSNKKVKNSVAEMSVEVMEEV